MGVLGGEVTINTLPDNMTRIAVRGLTTMFLMTAVALGIILIFVTCSVYFIWS